MQITTFYFDMDGTIADLYGVENWLKDLRAEKTRPYEEALPLIDCEKLVKIIVSLKSKGYRFSIISWSSKIASPEYRKRIRKVKVAWLKKYFPNCFDEIHVIKHGTPKHYLAKNGGILFDDEEKNRERWNKGKSFSEKEIFKILEQY